MADVMEGVPGSPGITVASPVKAPTSSSADADAGEVHMDPVQTPEQPQAGHELHIAPPTPSSEPEVARGLDISPMSSDAEGEDHDQSMDGPARGADATTKADEDEDNDDEDDDDDDESDNNGEGSSKWKPLAAPQPDPVKIAKKQEALVGMAALADRLKQRKMNLQAGLVQRRAPLPPTAVEATVTRIPKFIDLEKTPKLDLTEPKSPQRTDNKRKLAMSAENSRKALRAGLEAQRIRAQTRYKPAPAPRVAPKTVEPTVTAEDKTEEDTTKDVEMEPDAENESEGGDAESREASSPAPSSLSPVKSPERPAASNATKEIAKPTTMWPIFAGAAAAAAAAAASSTKAASPTDSPTKDAEDVSTQETQPFVAAADDEANWGFHVMDSDSEGEPATQTLGAKKSKKSKKSKKQKTQAPAESTGAEDVESTADDAAAADDEGDGSEAEADDEEVEAEAEADEVADEATKKDKKKSRNSAYRMMLAQEARQARMNKNLNFIEAEAEESEDENQQLAEGIGDFGGKKNQDIRALLDPKHQSDDDEDALDEELANENLDHIVDELSDDEEEGDIAKAHAEREIAADEERVADLTKKLRERVKKAAERGDGSDEEGLDEEERLARNELEREERWDEDGYGDGDDYEDGDGDQDGDDDGGEDQADEEDALQMLDNLEGEDDAESDSEEAKMAQAYAMKKAINAVQREAKTKGLQMLAQKESQDILKLMAPQKRVATLISRSVSLLSATGSRMGSSLSRTGTSSSAGTPTTSSLVSPIPSLVRAHSFNTTAEVEQPQGWFNPSAIDSQPVRDTSSNLGAPSFYNAVMSGSKMASSNSNAGRSFAANGGRTVAAATSGPRAMFVTDSSSRTGHGSDSHMGGASSNSRLGSSTSLQRSATERTAAPAKTARPAMPAATSSLFRMVTSGSVVSRPGR